MALRIAVLNDYPIDQALEMVAQLTYPAQHTWGVSAFTQLGVQPVLIPFRGVGLWPSLRAQLLTLLWQRRFDLVYSACQSETWLLARLRAWGLFRRPIVAVIHHPISGRLRSGSGFMRGHDRLLFLARRAHAQALQAWPSCKDRSELLPWGVDLHFYDSQPDWAHPYGQDYFVSAGKANRDHQTLADCAAAGQHRTLIVCSEATRPAGEAQPWVTVVSNASGHAMSYGQLTAVYRSARAVVIPLLDVSGLAGLTSLLDAMACGKPVIMTRNELVDVDIEALGFGIWVAPGDAAALRRAMDRLAGDDALVRTMGAKARAFAQDAYSYDAFARRVVAHCVAAQQASRSPGTS